MVLDQDGISLFHRENGGWRGLGKADPSDPLLAQQLRYLQRTATELSGGQFATKLVIPNSQILYKDMQIEPATDELRNAMIHAELDGATPYALDDLVFDWCDAGDNRVKVAVVARETLYEAEAFAVEHRFNPVSFVAAPNPEIFAEEPFFGETNFSDMLLSQDDSVEPDDDVFSMIQQAEISDLPVVEVEAAQGVIPAAPPIEPQVEEPTPEPEPEILPDPPAEPAFSTRRSLQSGPVPDEPLALKWVTPRIAVGARNVAPVSVPTDSDGNAVKAEITPMAVTAPQLAAAPQKRVGTSSAPAIPVAPENRNRTPVPPQRRSYEDEAKSLTVFGARDATPGAPRLGHFKLSIATGAAAAVALGILVVSGLFGGPSEDVQLTFEDLGEAQSASAQVASATFTDLADLPSSDATDANAPNAGVEVASLSPPDISVSDLAVPSPEESAELETSADPQELMSQDVAQAAYALTGIWQRAPDPLPDPKADHLDDFYVASIDHPVVVQDAVALPQIDRAQPDSGLQAMLPPAPAGTTFDFDENGLVRATPDGALTPDGIRIFAGQPAQVPTLRPFTAPSVAPEPTPSDQIIGIPPLPRPENLVAQTQRDRLGGRTLADLAEVRPLARPASAQEVQEVEGTETTELSRLAIDTSRRPAARPNSLAKSVEQALAAATVNAAVEDAVAEAATSDTSTQDTAPQEEPVAVAASAAVAPTAPSKPSVAKEATVKRGIKLSSINLIGVYGSSSDRRALVRLTSGRYVKVQVGDRLDGGRVASISSSELKYVKSGRNVTLKLPTG